jgi:peroxiredoxin
VYTYFAILALLQTPVLLRAGVALTEDCSSSSKVLADLPANASVQVRGSIAGDEATCYSVTTVLNGTPVKGYVQGNGLSAVAEFERRRAALSASTDKPRQAAPAAPARPHYPLFKDFSALDMKGRAVSAHGMKGRVNLVCFWSPSNQESVREVLAVTRLYGQFKQQGVDVLGVSLSDRPELADALEDFQLVFPNVPNGYDIAERHNVNDIPFTYVLNENHEVVASGLHAKALEELVKKLVAAQ